MRIKIEIDCETIDEVFAHIWVIRKQIKKAFKEHPSPKKKIVLDDDNCYGSHEITINNTGVNKTL